MKARLNFSNSQSNQLAVIEEADEAFVTEAANNCQIQRKNKSSLILSQEGSLPKPKDTTKVCLTKYRIKLNLKKALSNEQPILHPEMSRTFYAKKEAPESIIKAQQSISKNTNYACNINSINYESDNPMKGNLRNTKCPKSKLRDLEPRNSKVKEQKQEHCRFASSQGFNSLSSGDSQVYKIQSSSFVDTKDVDYYQNSVEDANRIHTTSSIPSNIIAKRRSIIVSRSEVGKKRSKRAFGASNGFQILKHLNMKEDLVKNSGKLQREFLKNRRKSVNGNKSQSLKEFEFETGQPRNKSLASFSVERSSNHLGNDSSFKLNRKKKIKVNTAYGTSFVCNRTFEDNSTAEDEEESRDFLLIKNTGSLIRFRTDSTGFPCNRRLNKYDILLKGKRQ
ncbi:unnamed protein product [Moneuplotes crassus]|uniref:Uncharacterized protein n=1 Tax=Euplotes crassus TaxID=5936 RepID=A0AAD1UGH0_EUPCR|nr:unnamed protein product [Moneuplotes crassus]